MPRGKRFEFGINFLEFLQESANYKRCASRAYFSDYYYNEHLFRQDQISKFLIEQGKKLSPAERIYWQKYHGPVQRDIILETNGLKELVEKEGWTPETAKIVEQKLQTLPKNWKYFVPPSSDQYAAIKSNEMAFQKAIWFKKKNGKWPNEI